MAIKTKVSNDERCLDVVLSSKKQGANVCQWKFNGISNQLWRLVPVDVETPSQEPTNEPTPSVEPEEAKIKVSIPAGGGREVTSALAKRFEITGTTDEKVDLSKLVFRYYYTEDGTQEQKLLLDDAVMLYEVSPFYQNIKADINATLVKMDEPTELADTYLEVGFNGDYKINNTIIGQVAVRVTKEDWSSFDQKKDFSFNDDDKIAVYYNGRLVAGMEP